MTVCFKCGETVEGEGFSCAYCSVAPCCLQCYTEHISTVASRAPDLVYGSLDKRHPVPPIAPLTEADWQTNETIARRLNEVIVAVNLANAKADALLYVAEEMFRKEEERERAEGGQRDVRPVLAIDFDGVIYCYGLAGGDGESVDGPMPGALEGLQALYARGYDIVIHTCRTDHAEVRAILDGWYGGAAPFPYRVTNVKPAALAYIDDRGVRFTGWADVLAAFPQPDTGHVLVPGEDEGS